MATVHVGKSLGDEDELWRYLSLDKFIDLVSSNSLFFAPLAWYDKTDPFEGFMPRVAMDALASIPQYFRDEQREVLARLVEQLPPAAGPQLQTLLADIEAYVPSMKALYKNIVSCLMVNCWYQSPHESEAMWGLYSRQGVAIRTRVGRLRNALVNEDPKPAVHIGAIKYLDFTDPALTAKDCMTPDGHLMGMMKRMAYAHEREVRMFITAERAIGDLSLHAPSSMRVAAEARGYLDEVVVSPFAGESLERSVRAVITWAGLDEGLVRRSTLLDGCDHLLDAYQ